MIQKKTEMPSYVVVRHGPGAVCLSIRDLTRDEVLGALFALTEFFSQETDSVYETTDFKTGERIIVHPPGRA